MKLRLSVGLSLILMVLLTTLVSQPAAARARVTTNPLIVDDGDPPPYFVAGGQSDPAQPQFWDFAPVGYLGQTRWTGNSINATAHNWATWSVLSGLNGTVEVQVTVPSLGPGYPLTHEAHYIVHHAGGTTDVPVDQAAHAGGVASLGTFTFNGSGSVYLTDVVLERGRSFLSYVVFDAVSFGAGFDPNLDITPPLIENVKAQAQQGQFIIQAKVTDNESGVGQVLLYFNGHAYAMIEGPASIYSFAVPYAKGATLDYSIVATDNAGNTAMWSKARGYVSYGIYGRNLGIPGWINCPCDTAPSAAKRLPPPQAQCNGQCTGDPINTQNGNLIERDALITLHGRPEINLQITYNSQGGLLSIFGQQWTHNYNWHVLEMNSSSYVGAFVQYPSGQIVEFAGAGFTPEPGVFEVLTQTASGYELKYRDQSRVLFDADGDIVRWEDPNGNGITFSYGTKTPFTLLSQPTTIQADGGRSLTLEYNDHGMVKKISGPEGKVLEFKYSKDDDLTSIQDARTNITQFEYTDHLMTKKISPEGHPYFVNTYGAERKVIEQTAGAAYKQTYTYGANQTTVVDANNNSTTYVYNADQLLEKVIDARGKMSTFEYTAQKQTKVMIDKDNHRFEYDYDANGNAVYEKDPLNYEITRTFDTTLNKATKEVYKLPDHITHWEYDGHGNLKKIINAQNAERTFEYNEHGQLKRETDFNGNPTTYTYTPQGDVETITDATNGVQHFAYDGVGRVQTYTNARTFSFSYTYDGNDNLGSVDGPLGYHLAYEYDKNNNKVTDIDANGGHTTYRYDDSENLVEVKNPLQFPTQYTYGPMNEKLSQTDAEGRVTRWEYDPVYNAKTEIRAAGRAEEAITRYEYNGMGDKVRMIDPLSRITDDEYDPLHRLTKETRNVAPRTPDSETNVVTRYEYNGAGALTKITDPNNNAKTLTVDSLDQVTKSKDAEEETTEFRYDKQGNLIWMQNPRTFVTRYEYDALNRMKLMIDAKGGKTSYAYDHNSNQTASTDSNGVTTSYTYNALDRKANRIENYKPGQPADVQTNVTTEYEYDLHGNLTGVKNPRGFWTHFKYDPAHRNTEIRDAYDKTATFVYDRVDNLTGISDRNQHSKGYTYDALNRVVGTLSPESYTEQLGYDKVGNQTSFINMRGKLFSKAYDPLNRVKVETDPYLKTKIYTYDPVGNILTLTDENGHTDRYEYDRVYRTSKAYDAENNMTEYRYDPNGNLLKKIDAETNPTSYDYDELDRLIATTNAEGEQENYSYDRMTHLTTKTAADKTVDTFTYDPLYRLAQVVNNYKLSPVRTNDTNVQTQYRYDANGNLLKTIDPLNHVTTFDYDALDRLHIETNPLGNLWQYEYDPEGNRTQRIDANGALTLYDYYPDNMLRTITYPTYQVQYRYNETNFATQMIDNLGTTTWAYDDLDRLTSQRDPLQRSIGYAYDFVGNLTQLQYPDNRTVSNSYLRNDWLRQATSSDGDGVTYTRNKVGMPIELDRTNATMSQTMYDRVYRPLVVHDQQVGHGNHLITQFGYTYNKVGHKTQEVADYGWRQPAHVVTTYAYDGMHRIARATSTDGQDTGYTYDAAGNRIQVQETLQQGIETRTFAYNAANELQTIAVQSPHPPNRVTCRYQYDNNGNRIDKLVDDPTGIDRGTHYTYDPENRILVAQDYQTQLGSPKQPPAVELAHTNLQYDGDGRQLVKTYYPGGSQPGQRTEYTVDHLDAIAEYTMWDGQRNNLYRNSAQDLLFYQHFRSERDPNGTLYVYHQDGEGNIAATTKFDGQSDHSYRYDEYGAVLPEQGNWTAPHNEYTLSQKQYDANMDLYSFGARDYDAYAGSWVTQDTYRGELNNPQSLHRYMYNYDSPINYVDAYGFQGDDFLSRLKQGISDGYNYTTQKISDGYNYATQKIGEGYEYVKVGVESAIDPRLGQIEVNKKVFGMAVTDAQRDQILSQEQYMKEATLKRKIEREMASGNLSCEVYGRFAQLLAGTNTQLSRLQTAYRDAAYRQLIDTQDIRHRSEIMGYIPVVGAGYNFANFYLGYNVLTGDKLSTGNRVTALIAGSANVVVTAVALYGAQEVVVSAGRTAVTSSEGGSTMVYRSVDEGVTNYVGITNNFLRRSAEHLATKGINIEPIQGLTNLTRADARAVEQVLIERYGLENLLNEINSISTANPTYGEAIQRGIQILEGIGW